jgi:hypothetical protein
MSGRSGLLVVVSGIALSFAPQGSAAPSSFVIQWDYKIGGYTVKEDGTLFGAIKEFGEPTSLRRGGRRLRGWNACVARWRQLGLRIVFYNLGGQDPCKPQYGYFRDALITGKQWRTSKGLRVGQPWRYIFRYYARPMTRNGTWWSLVRRRWPYGSGGTYGALSAKVMNGWVIAFQVYYQAGGE